MIEFKPYESKPITRTAIQITDKYEVVKSMQFPSTYYLIDDENTDNSVRFKAYEEPKIGDWVVRLTDDDTYHVTDAVFRGRNIVT